MDSKAEGFSASAALAEAEFQEHLLRALAREVANLREETESKEPSPRKTGGPD